MIVNANGNTVYGHNIHRLFRARSRSKINIKTRYIFMRALCYVNIWALHPRVRKDKNENKHHIPPIEHVREFLEYGLKGYSRKHRGPLAASEHWPDEEHAHNGSTQLQNDWQAVILVWLYWFVRQLKEDALEEEKTRHYVCSSKECRHHSSTFTTIHTKFEIFTWQHLYTYFVREKNN